LFEDAGAKGRIRDGLELWTGKQELRAAEQARAERDAGRRRFADTLAAGFDDGSSDAVHIDLALASGAIDATGADDLRLRLGAAEAHTEEIGRLDGMLRGGDASEAPDPDMPFTAATVDAWWQRLAAGDPVTAKALLSKLVTATGLVPSGLRNGLRAVILDGGAGQMVKLGNQLRRIRASSPQAARVLMAALPEDEALSVRALAYTNAH
jgi:hypothetical protein